MTQAMPQVIGSFGIHESRGVIVIRISNYRQCHFLTKHYQIFERLGHIHLRSLTNLWLKLAIFVYKS